jgi:VIT1/CCC1 family predicted Fe2+/Mn2+ transporter/rubrerythrin
MKSDAENAKAVAALEANWRAERETALVYRDLAANDADEKRRGILLRMAEAEERHALRWESKLRELGAQPPVLKNDWRQRLNRWWNRTAGADVAIRRMEAAEDRDKERYQAQRAGTLGGDAEEQEFLRQTALEEKAHSRVLNTMSAAPPSLGPKGLLDTILKRERWHGRGGGWVADAIYGVNDGLGAVFGIVSGVAGATDNQQHYILVAGLAGMLASSLSMGAGAYLANKSEREIYEAEIAREKAEVEENPEEEIEEMSLFYQLQGFAPEESQRMAERLAEQPEQMVQAMAQSELGLSQHHFPNQWTSAFSAALSTAIGAFIPIIPFFFMSGFPAVIAAVIASWAPVGGEHLTPPLGWASGLSRRSWVMGGGTYGLRLRGAPENSGMTRPQLAVCRPGFNKAQRLTDTPLGFAGLQASGLTWSMTARDGRAGRRRTFRAASHALARVLRFGEPRGVMPFARLRRLAPSRFSDADLSTPSRNCRRSRTDRAQLRHRPSSRAPTGDATAGFVAAIGRQGLQWDCALGDRSSVFRHPVRLQSIPNGSRPADHRAGTDRWLRLRCRIALPRAARRLAHARGAGPLGSQRGKQGPNCARQLAHVCRSRELAHAGRGWKTAGRSCENVAVRGNPPRLCKDGEIFSKTIR